MGKTLLLVDGSSFLYRAFHALPDLRNPQGEPTGAIYGMLGMLRRLKVDYKADYAACVFDARGKTFRDDLFADYKANRASMPEDLAAQIEPIHQAVVAMGWPLLVVEGIEADDVIGTLAVKATALGFDTLIATGDKDLAQLVNPQVRLVNTMTRDGGPAEVLDEPGVLTKFGVTPQRIIDWLMLVGDSVDNVPGVDKVGPKTAVKWLNEYGSIEGVVAAAPTMKGVTGENLRRAIDFFPLSRQLLTVKIDCDLAAHVEGIADQLQGLAWREQDTLALRNVLARYGFRTWLKELDAQLQAGGEAVPAADAPAGLPQNLSAVTEAHAAVAGASPEIDKVSGRVVVPAMRPAAVVKPAQFHAVLTPSAFDALLQTIDTAELTAFDTETTSLDPLQARLVGLSFSVEVGTAWYVPIGHDYAGAPEQLPYDEVLARLKPWLESAAHKKVGQHLKYDAHVLENHGIRLAGIAHDTMLESYVLEAHLNHNMDVLADRHLGRKTITYEEVAGKGASQIPFSQVSVEDATRYAAEDADVTLELHQTLWPKVQNDAGLLHVYQDIELPAAEVLQRIERHGVLIDVGKLQAQSHAIGLRLAELEKQAHEQAGQPFNLASPKQLGEILFGKLGLPVVKKTASGAPSTDEDVLVKLADDYPLPKLLLEHRSLAKLKGTYTDKLPKMVNPATGRVHTRFAQAVAVTGRLASTDPNLQNIPIRTAEGRRIREAFIAAPGCQLMSADYSQIELRIMAHLSQDEGLLKAFAEGMDVHRATAAEIFGSTPDAVTSEQRRYAKVINFGLIYGMSAFGLAQNLGIDRKAANLYIERYFLRYPGVARYMDQTRAQAKEQGYVQTVFGRRLWLAEINSPNGPRRAAAERAAINAPMQGTAADLIKLAMVAVQKHLDQAQWQTRMILQVHDELVFEVPQAEMQALREVLPGLMQNVAQLSVPLLVEIGQGANWEEAH